jgi:ABC-type glycerol-3-phosphate transport system substrate-binding protein
MAHPFLIWVEADDFAEANVPQPPAMGWTVDQLLDALVTLQPTMDTGTSAFQISLESGSTQILLLTAAFGGLPLDYRTNPPTADFTSEETVAALRQVLDLIKAGSIQYYPLSRFEARHGAFGYAPIYANQFTWILSDGLPDTNYIPVNYPQGSLYTPASYTLDMAFIKRSSIDPQACYDWIRFISGHSDLFDGVPVLESTIDDFLANADNIFMSPFYRAFGDTLQADNLVTYPNVRLGPSAPEHQWLNQVFDRYVLEDADLEQELAQAEQFVREYRECVGEEALIHIPPPDERRRIDIYHDCARKVDPNYWGEIFISG